MPRLALTLLLLLVQVAGARQPASEEIRLAGEIELKRLVDLAAERLDLNIEYEPNALNAKVTLRLGEGISDEGLWALVNRLLASRGLTTVRLPGDPAVGVVRLGDAHGLARVEESQAEGAGQAGYATIVVQPEHVAPGALAEALEPLLSHPGGRAEVMAKLGLLLISDLRPRLDQAVSMLERLDVPDREVVVERIPLSNVEASTMVTLLAEVNARRESAGGIPYSGEVVAAPDAGELLYIGPAAGLESWRALVRGLDRRQPVSTRTYSPQYFSAADVGGILEEFMAEPRDERFRLVVDDLTGTLIVTATNTDHERIAELLARLDSVPPSQQRPIRSFVVRNRELADLMGAIKGLLAAGVLDGATHDGEPDPYPVPPLEDGRTAQPPPTTSESMAAAAPRRADLTLAADEATSTIIAMGPPRLLDELEKLIEQLDVRRAQVVLEILLVGITDSQAVNLGVQIDRLIDGDDDTVIRLASIFGLGTNVGSAFPAVGSGLSGVVLDPGQFAIVIRALETINEGRTLTMPRLLVQHGESATLDSVQEEPTISINASNTVSTTSFAGFESAGTQVTVAPQIAEGDHLLLQYSVSVSSFTGETSEAGVPPPRQQNSLQGVATIPDGFTIVVGGIQQSTYGDAENRVPLIGRIPLLGAAFKNRSKSQSEAKFYAFIRPTILRATDFTDLKHVSSANLEEVGLEDAWPSVEPQIVR